VKIPRDVNGVEAVRALKHLGFVSLRQTGSHLIMRKDSLTVVVPQHKPLKPGTLKGVIEQAGLTLEEFINEL
jgi:predicted RNA binding protein YcfA (HicA-like mRNA interferase family)